MVVRGPASTSQLPLVSVATRTPCPLQTSKEPVDTGTLWFFRGRKCLSGHPAAPTLAPRVSSCFLW